MRTNTSIDWLTISGKNYIAGVRNEHLTKHEVHQLARWVFAQIVGEKPDFEEVKPRPFYSWCLKDPVTGVRINVSTDLAGQGWLVEVPGRANYSGVNMLRILDWAVKNQRNITRLDVAVDLFDSGLSVEKEADLHRRTVEEKGSGTAALIISETGSTAYFGSRSSLKMMRFYDKAAEQRAQMDWKRAELETKAETAMAVARSLLNGTEKTYALMRDMVKSEDSELRSALAKLAGEALPVRTTKIKARPKRGIWLRDQVLKAVEAYSKSDLEDLEDWWVDVWHVIQDRKQERDLGRLPEVDQNLK
jgi:DNA relaxase NicK